MFKNSVFNASVDTREWIKATAIRAVKTFAESFVSMVTVGQAFSEVNWLYVFSVSGVAAVISVAVSVAGIPEAKVFEEVENEENVE